MKWCIFTWFIWLKGPTPGPSNSHFRSI